MPFTEHLNELGHRIRLTGLTALLAGVTGALLAPDLLPLVAFIYNLPIEVALRSLPPEPRLTELLAMMLGGWAGLPVLVYQLWLFTMPGLTLREIRLARPIVLSIIIALMSTPLAAAVVSRGVSMLAATFQIGQDVETMMKLTERMTTGILIVFFWSIGFRPLWNWLTLQSRANYVLRLATGQPVLRASASSAILRDSVFSLAITSSLILPFVPMHLILALLLGLFVLLQVFGMFCLTAARLVGHVKDLLGKRFFLELISFGYRGLDAAFCWPFVIIGLMLLQKSAQQTVSWLMFGASEPFISTLRAGVGNPTDSWFVFIYAAWFSMVIVNAVSFLHLLFNRKLDARLGEMLGRLVPLSIVVALLPMSGEFWRILSKIGPQYGLSQAACVWLSTHLAIFTSFSVIGLFLLLSIRKAIQKRKPIFVLQIILILLFLSIVPTVVLAGGVAFPAFCAILSLPVAISILARLGIRSIIDGFQVFRDAFKRAAEDVKQELTIAG
jgi:hypothetical protein